jgi:hypothetical protein
MRAALIAVLVTAAAAGCEKADEHESRSASPAVARPPVAATKAVANEPAKTPPAPAEGRALDGLAFTIPSGWTAEQDVSGQWIFQLQGTDVIARLNRAPDHVPTTGSGYLEYKVEWCWDPGTTADLVDNQSRPGGFGATMLVRDAEDPDKPRLAYHAVWEVDGVRLRCEADRVPDASVRDQIAALCSSARW